MDAITSADLCVYPTGADARQLDFAAERASALVAAAWVAPSVGAPWPEWVRSIAIEVALRWLYNPKGLESLTVAVDDASRTERNGRLAAGGGHGLSLTDAERRALGGIRQMRSRVGSIGLSVPGYR